MVTRDKLPRIPNDLPFTQLTIAPRSYFERCYRCKQPAGESQVAVRTNSGVRVYNLDCWLKEVTNKLRVLVDTQQYTPKLDLSANDDKVPNRSRYVEEGEPSDADAQDSDVDDFSAASAAPQNGTTSVRSLADLARPTWKAVDPQLVSRPLTYEQFADPEDWLLRLGKYERNWPLYRWRDAPVDVPVYFVQVYLDEKTGSWAFFAKPEGVAYRTQPEMMRRGFVSRKAATRRLYDWFIAPVLEGRQPHHGWLE